MKKKYTILFIIIIEIIALIIICVVLVSPVIYSKFDSIDTLSIWATVITLVFLVFSVMGLWNIDNKISELDHVKSNLNSKLLNLEQTTNELVISAKQERTKIMEEAQNGINKIMTASANRQNLFDTISRALVEPAPDKRLLMFTNILRENPNAEGVNYSYIYSCRGMTYLDMGQKEKALTDLKKSLKLDMKTDAPLVSLGFYYARIKDYPKSIEYYKMAIDKNPTKASNYMDTATSYGAMGDYEHADEYYEKGLTFEPDSASAYYNKALNLKKKGSKDLELMEHYIDHALMINPMFFTAKINKASLHRDQNDNSGAIKILTEVIGAGVSKDYIMALEQRGIAYRLIGMYPQALINFNHVFLLDPTNVQNLSNISATHMNMMQINEAWSYLLEGFYQANIQNEHTCDSDFKIVLDTIQNNTPFPMAKNFEVDKYIEERKNKEKKYT